MATPNVPTGAGPRNVVAADLNGDAKQDLVVVNSLDNTVSVFLSNGDGTFGAAVTFAVGVQPNGVSVGDFNGDGKLDLAVTNEGTKAISVLLGKGDGTFQPAVNYATSDFTANVVGGDFNGDGKLDLAVTDFSGGVDVLLGNGDGTFKSSLTTATGIYAGGLVAGDFNSDGKTDFAVINNNSSNISVLLGNGNGTFNAGAVYSFPKGLMAIVAADLNMDGKLDLVFVDSNTFTGNPTALSVMLGNGDGTFSAAAGYGSAVDPFYVVLGDFDGDGKQDAAVTDQLTNVVRILLGKGDGTFQQSIEYATGMTAEGIAAGDFNGDGRVDLAVADYRSNDASVLLGSGDGTFRGARSYDLGIVVNTTTPSVVLGDFNRDGKLDVASPLNGVTLLFGNGDGTLQPPTAFFVAQDLTNGGLVAADFNHDGNLDLAATTNWTIALDDRAALILLGKGDGTFQEQDIGIGQMPFGIAVGDFNADGNPDLAIGQAILQGDGAGNFSSFWSVLPSNYAIVSADFNRDGKPDLLTYDSTYLELGLGNGNNTFQWTFLPGTFDGCSTLSTGIVTADINVDGTPDLVLACPTNASGYVNVLLGNGDGIFQSPVSYVAGYRPQAVAVADLNLDGHPDLIVVGVGSLSVMLGNGDGTFQPSLNFDAPGSGVVSLAVGDLNGDGLPDIVLMNSFYNGLNYGSVTVVLNQTGLVASLTPTTLAFGAQQLGTTSPSQTAILINKGTSTLTITGINVGGTNSTDFSQTNNCGPSLVAGASCVIFVTFAPTALGARSAAVSVTDSALGGTQTLALSGTGTGAVATLSAASLNFGSQTVGFTSFPQSVTLTNTGNVILTISAIGTTGTNSADFAQTNTCGTSVAAGASCTITMTFTPTSTGTRNAAVTVTDNAPNSPQTVSLSGVGVLPAVTLSPTSLAFPTQVVFTTSKAKTATLTNTGAGILSIANISVPGFFTQTNTCGTTIAAGGSCTFTVKFKPTTIGTLAGSVSITDNAPGSPHKIALTGVGTYVQLSPTSLNFGNQPVGTKSLSKKITLSNKGSVAVSITNISVVGTNAKDFSQTNTCRNSVAAGASCFIGVTFMPSAKGNRAAAVSITDNGGGSPQKVSLAGTGT